MMEPNYVWCVHTIEQSVYVIQDLLQGYCVGIQGRQMYLNSSQEHMVLKNYT